MQLSFNFPFQDKYLLQDFIISSCNQKVFDFVQNYKPFQDKNLPKIFAISSPTMSGKTYLANIWQRKFTAEFLTLPDLANINLIKLIKARNFYIVEDIDKITTPDLLLQIFNLVQEKSAFLLLTSAVNLNYLNFSIKDLNSRLINVFSLEISRPDDVMIEMLLTKNFAIKQLRVEKKVIDFLVNNLSRSFESIANVVKLLEFYSLERKSNININLTKEAVLVLSKEN